MAIKAKELRQKAGKIHTEMNDILTKSTDKMSEEDDKKWDSLDKEYNSLMKQAEKIEAHEKREIEEAEETKEVEKTLKKGDLNPEQKKEREKLAITEYMATGTVSPELREHMKPAKREDDDKSFLDTEFKRLGLVRAATQSTSDGSGGYTIPQGFQAELERAMLAYGGVQQVCRTWRTATGNPVDWPLVNDTQNEAYLLAEAGNAETDAEKIKDQTKPFEAYKYTSGLIRVSSELIQDSAFDMPGLVRDFLAERMGRGVNRALTTADGSNKPKGVTVGATHGNNTTDDAAIAYDDWVDLIHEIDPAYRLNSRFMFHDTVLKTIKKLKDSQNQPVWLPSMRDGEPATIFGHPYTINQHMASYVAGSTSANDNKKIALFGDFSKYIFRLVTNFRFVRLNERFGDTDQVGFVLFFRFDGDLLDAGTHPIKYMRVSAT